MTESQQPQEQQDGPQTVTQFAVQEGNLDADAPGVQETIDAEKERAEAGTERAQQVSEALNASDDDDTRQVSPEEGGGQG